MEMHQLQMPRSSKIAQIENDNVEDQNAAQIPSVSLDPMKSTEASERPLKNNRSPMTAREIQERHKTL
jgi:hypothetical protein